MVNSTSKSDEPIVKTIDRADRSKLSTIETASDHTKKCSPELSYVKDSPDNNTFSSSSTKSEEKRTPTPPNFIKDQKVNVMSPNNENLCVAWGIVKENDPGHIIGEAKLGKNYVGILIEKIIIKEEELIRPYDNYEKIGDVDAGKTIIAWSKRMCK